MDENTVDNELDQKPLNEPETEDVEMGSDDLFLEKDDYSEFDDDDDSEDEEPEKESESDEKEKSDEEKEEGADDKPAENAEVQPSDSKTAGDNSDGKSEVVSDRQKLIQDIAKELEAEDIPNTPEYRKSAITEAKKAVCRELNIAEDDFNNFDEEHQFLFSEKLEEIRAQKKQKFDAVVERIEKKHSEADRVSRIQNLITSQCDTPEKRTALYNIIRGASTGYTEDMKKELLQGKTDKLQKLINVATGKKKLASPKKHSSKNTKTGRDRGYASDLVFGF